MSQSKLDDSIVQIENPPRPPSGDMTGWQKHTLLPAPSIKQDHHKFNLTPKQIEYILALKDVVDQYREEGCFCKTIIPPGITYLRQELSFNNESMSAAELKKIINFLSINKDKEGEGNAVIYYKKFYDRAKRQFPDLIEQINAEYINKTTSMRI
jgi:hypothetical protein